MQVGLRLLFLKSVISVPSENEVGFVKNRKKGFNYRFRKIQINKKNIFWKPDENRKILERL